MSLTAILTTINATLTANGSLPSTAALEFGPTIKRDRSVPARVTWVPGRDRFDGPRGAMTRAEQQAFFTANPGKQIPRELHTRWAGVEAHIWAGGAASSDDYSATEALVQAVISAIHQAVYGAYELEPSGWVNPRSSEGNLLGHRYVLNVAFRIPMLEVQTISPANPEDVVITTITQTDQIGPLPPGGSTISSTP